MSGILPTILPPLQPLVQCLDPHGMPIPPTAAPDGTISALAEETIKKRKWEAETDSLDTVVPGKNPSVDDVAAKVLPKRAKVEPVSDVQESRPEFVRTIILDQAGHLRVTLTDKEEKRLMRCSDKFKQLRANSSDRDIFLIVPPHIEKPAEILINFAKKNETLPPAIVDASFYHAAVFLEMPFHKTIKFESFKYLENEYSATSRNVSTCRELFRRCASMTPHDPSHYEVLYGVALNDPELLQLYALNRDNLSENTKFMLQFLEQNGGNNPCTKFTLDTAAWSTFGYKHGLLKVSFLCPRINELTIIASESDVLCKLFDEDLLRAFFLKLKKLIYKNSDEISSRAFRQLIERCTALEEFEFINNKVEERCIALLFTMPALKRFSVLTGSSHNLPLVYFKKDGAWKVQESVQYK